MDITTLKNYVTKDTEHTYFLQILENMPPEIARGITISTAPADTILAYAGEDFKTVYILLEGIIKLSYELNTEFIYSFASIRPFNILGETESFTNHPTYKASLICHTQCSYIAMPKNQFLTWMHSDINSLYHMTEHIAHKYTHQVRQDRTLLSATGEERFIYLLVKYFYANHIGGTCTISAPKEQLADEICVSIKTISRCIAKMKKDGLISSKGHNIVITRAQAESLEDQYSELLEGCFGNTR
ncbi:MAG: Crp/Fnr family transcriptional regulator [Clostridia bacterium]|nr:Crp/Fnr family transcriptional regulator [Clostridia bacterium]NCC44946.1 Crp/Fnr family transcriptional regulator [Clostridia bacterium]